MKRFCTRALLLLLAAVMLAASAQAAVSYSTLAFGSRGTEVKQLQTMLLQLGFYTGTADGKYGRGTESAVTAYQQARGLTADGKAGSLTRAKLVSECGGTTSTGTVSKTDPNTLVRGDSGDKVSQLQAALKNLGYYSGTVDGNFGSGTERAVTAFQRASGLTADGKAGVQTQAKLYNQSGSSSGNNSENTGSSGSVSGFTRTLRRGYTGSDVSNVQTRLKALGYYTGSVDGKYGSGTIAAVTSFQKKNSLTADGKVGPATYSKLFDSSAASSSSGGSAESSTTTKLQSGDKGSAVKAMQQALKDLGYSVSADGSYGAQTLQAVMTFQKQNGLSADGVAGTKTLTLLYSGSAKRYDASQGSGSGSSGSGSSSGSSGTAAGPNGSTLQLLHWFNDVKNAISNGSKLTVYDPATGLQWTLRVMSRGRHCDAEPLTADDTATMIQAFGGKTAWVAKPVYVKLPDGRWTLATSHDMPHLSGSIKDNNFDGHLCVHFLRDMDECQKNDPNWGVTNQKAIRSAWKSLTGITVD